MWRTVLGLSALYPKVTVVGKAIQKIENSCDFFGEREFLMV